MVAAQGPWLTDADGNRLVDLVSSWGPMILGHAHPAVVDAVRSAAGSGLSFGAPTPAEVELAEEIIARVAPVEQVRLVNSGTEATMSAIRLARVITEAAAGNMGAIAPLPGFNAGLRDACHDHGALLVVDEVMTGFRVSPAGWFGLDGVAGDLYTFGKVMSGGLPAAAFGGPAALMGHLAPAGPVYQAGTLSGNPVAVAAGLATLRQADDAVYATLDANAERLARMLGAALAAEG